MFAPSVIFLSALAGNTSQKDIEYLYCLHGYLVAVVIVLTLVLLSLTVNRYINSSNNKNIAFKTGKMNDNINEIKEKRVIDTDLEAKRIYDSIIK